MSTETTEFRLTPPSAHETPIVDMLPPEILTQIFWHLPRLFDNIHTPVPPWAVVLHVCHRWREISSGYAHLWTLVPLANTQWTELALRLSHPCPIDIHFPDPVLACHREPIRAAMQNSQRAYSLDLRTMYTSGHMPDMAFDDTFFQALRDRPPVDLAELSLWGLSLFGKENKFCEETFGFLLSSQVRYLRITRCALPMNFIIPSTLVSLRLEFAIFDGWTLDHLTGLLSKLPLLEELALIAVPFESNISELISTSSITSVTLPRIKTLHLIAEAEFMAAYLLLLDIPAHPELSMRIIFLDSPRRLWQSSRLDAEQGYALIFPILEKHVRAVASQNTISLRLTKDSVSSVRCTVSSGSLSISCGLPSSPSTLTSLLPESACCAAIICECILPSLTLPAIVWRTSSYLQRMVFPNFLPISSCSLMTDANTGLSNLHELTFTELQDMADDGGGDVFHELLLVLQHTAAIVVFRGGVKFNDEQGTILERDYPGRVEFHSGGRVHSV